MKRPLTERGIGVIMLVCGSGLMYLGLVSPILHAMRHMPHVSLSPKAATLAPLAFGLGIVYSVFGSRANHILGHPQQPTKLGWIVAVVLFIVGIATYSSLKNALADYGYRF